jgi:hypothetical protein
MTTEVKKKGRNEKGNAVCHARALARRKANLTMSIAEFEKNGHGKTEQVVKMKKHLEKLVKG